jgi:hypothetical protein
MATQDELQQFRILIQEESRATEQRLKDFVKEEVGQLGRHLMGAITEQGHVLLEAIEINGREQIQLEKRVKRLERHLNLPPLK